MSTSGTCAFDWTGTIQSEIGGRLNSRLAESGRANRTTRHDRPALACCLDGSFRRRDAGVVIEEKFDTGTPLPIGAETTKNIFGRKTPQNQKRRILTVSASVFCVAQMKFDIGIKRLEGVLIIEWE
jgi:hypothetical protein